MHTINYCVGIAIAWLTAIDNEPYTLNTDRTWSSLCRLFARACSVGLTSDRTVSASAYMSPACAVSCRAVPSRLVPQSPPRAPRCRTCSLRSSWPSRAWCVTSQTSIQDRGLRCSRGRAPPPSFRFPDRHLPGFPQVCALSIHTRESYMDGFSRTRIVQMTPTVIEKLPLSGSGYSGYGAG